MIFYKVLFALLASSVLAAPIPNEDPSFTLEKRIGNANPIDPIQFFPMPQPIPLPAVPAPLPGPPRPIPTRRHTA
ncbi:hypothetical protein M408DRAFT_331284 [Serendipita vermifera MAFF 305830]|uniref:Uncharacterized protein n=1 Tax=Serendipita vermifera MAFF 305830 TaxID=933852 RepID=A0A0C3AYX9_SERVB|nr:hypothetical protein M408DRAFT_331284 [Serendipita vermifera MAFF 305830]